ncbi:hypothetical protein DMC25_17460 [Caulobacter sp. D4A]|uniref:DUF6881 domain-containing protein n=1 Tax=unclassified Caulobacter TaxID=2648921 RepID=UPI000D73B034|nr:MULTISPECIES: hypothetical protein [unclassified Caulobacter]PXA83878.1 hypothetical protein DMC25_17460 [Caulobacter sp. D4A]PXA94695.1 hypothetical protein DMC18_05775 [Caulobacter sp. D5]
MSLSHYRCDWTHDHADEPVTLFYEVDEDGRVLRMVDVFRDGRRERDSVENYFGPEADNLTDGDFYDSTENLRAGYEAVEGDERMSLIQIEAAAFEAAWRPDA